ncbi:MAG: hypothetical protein NZM31_03735, partial [Gemmatales bacterium]|nr:hypothetical protein [Gemmatales bacterium]MDW8386111.1 hypothetical protein [Gemmatales bacterium]
MELRIRVLREWGGFWGTGVQVPYDLVDWELIKKKSSLIYRPTPRALQWRVVAVILSVFFLAGFWLSLGPPWVSLAALREKQERAKEIPPERREAETKLAELANAWKNRLAPEELERIEREQQQRKEQLRQQAQRTDLLGEVARQILLWPISLLFLWLGGWYGVIGIIRFPFERLTIR